MSDLADSMAAVLKTLLGSIATAAHWPNLAQPGHILPHPTHVCRQAWTSESAGACPVPSQSEAWEGAGREGEEPVPQAESPLFTTMPYNAATGGFIQDSHQSKALRVGKRLHCDQGQGLSGRLLKPEGGEQLQRHRAKHRPLDTLHQGTRKRKKVGLGIHDSAAPGNVCEALLSQPLQNKQQAMTSADGGGSVGLDDRVAKRKRNKQQTRDPAFGCKTQQLSGGQPVERASPCPAASPVYPGPQVQAQVLVREEAEIEAEVETLPALAAAAEAATVAATEAAAKAATAKAAGQAHMAQAMAEEAAAAANTAVMEAEESRAMAQAEAAARAAAGEAAAAATAAEGAVDGATAAVEEVTAAKGAAMEAETLEETAEALKAGETPAQQAAAAENAAAGAAETAADEAVAAGEAASAVVSTEVESEVEVSAGPAARAAEAGDGGVALGSASSRSLQLQQHVLDVLHPGGEQSEESNQEEQAEEHQGKVGEVEESTREEEEGEARPDGLPLTPNLRSEHVHENLEQQQPKHRAWWPAAEPLIESNTEAGGSPDATADAEKALPPLQLHPGQGGCRVGWPGVEEDGGDEDKVDTAGKGGGWLRTVRGELDCGSREPSACMPSCQSMSEAINDGRTECGALVEGVDSHVTPALNRLAP